MVVGISCFSFLIAVVPGTGMGGPGRPLPILDWLLARNLSLREKTLVREPLPPELLATSTSSPELLDNLYLRFARGIDLKKRNLQGADFTGAKLFNADFRGAHLERAVFTNADLRKADFTPTGGADGRFTTEPGEDKLRDVDDAARARHGFSRTFLNGADLRRADCAARI